jgi:hypothetical protein
MSDTPVKREVSDDEFRRKPIDEHVRYLLRRDRDQSYALGYLLGQPPASGSISWDQVKALKGVIEFGLLQMAAGEQQKKDRAKRWAQLTRVTLSLTGALALWVLKQLFSPWVGRLLHLFQSGQGPGL